MRRLISPSLLAPVGGAVLLLTGCTTTNPPISGAQVPISGAQVPISNETPGTVPQQNEQLLRVTIMSGKFGSTVYSEQQGATRMLVITTGGPYLFEIDRLVDRREIPENGGTTINYDASTPGDYTIRAYLSTPDGTSPVADTATLRITAVGQ